MTLKKKETLEEKLKALEERVTALEEYVFSDTETLLSDEEVEALANNSDAYSSVIKMKDEADD